jgi:hypothetical protein
MDAVLARQIARPVVTRTPIRATSRTQDDKCRSLVQRFSSLARG